MSPLTPIRDRLAGLAGKAYWRSLEELAGTEEFRKLAADEFPSRSEEWLRPVNRREAGRLMAASLALAGITACTRQPRERIVPFVQQPEEYIPGRPLFFATTMPFGGAGMGLLVESHDGRPTKVEGNPLHPSSLGATDAFAQASVLELYDPDRSQAVLHRGRISSWPRFLAAMAQVRDRKRASRGAGLRILTGASTSPTLGGQMREILSGLPEARWYAYEPADSGGAYEGSNAVFGRALEPVYNLRDADVIVALDADFLAAGPGAMAYARQFADRRRITNGVTNLNRLYVAEPAMTPTGSVAEHRLPVRASGVEPLARALAQRLGVANAGGAAVDAPWLAAAAADLQGARGRSLVIAGQGQPAAVHALAHAINQALGNAGRTVSYIESPRLQPLNGVRSIGALAAEMRAGAVDTLIIAGVNPVYSAPADLEFASAMDKVGLRMHLGLYADETAERCHWHVPEAHYLESWGDARAHDGTASLIQPLIEPLYGGKSIYEFLAALTDAPDRRGYQVVQDHWRAERAGGQFNDFWTTALHDGVVPGSAFSPVAVGAPRSIPAPAAGGGNQDLEAIFRPHPCVWDGRFANNPWLQELPDPITKLTWDNAALMSAATAGALGVTSEDVVELRVNGRSARAPVLIAVGHADNCITLHSGFGRRRGGRIAAGAGFNAATIQPFAASEFGAAVEVRRTGERRELAITQNHHYLGPRDIVRSADLRHFQAHPDFAKRESHPQLSIYPEFAYNGYRWGMSIDQNVCTGCSACVIACVAENNIAVVGKQEVIKGRELHWLRIDTYFAGETANPEVAHQPMLCQHCEKAPCEPVCPVAATVHSGDGLSQMIYNRCVGTRYCSNNCPYKVRRFNFLLYADWEQEALRGVRNPDVTVRSRGVMEKCSFCIQRIQAAKIRAELENRRVRDGEVVTACQGVCPTRAIVFGDLNDRASEVARLAAQPVSYGVLAELNTQPRIGYQAIVRNPNEALGGGGFGPGGHSG